VLTNKSYANYHQKHDFNILWVPHLERPRMFANWSSRFRAPRLSHWTAINKTNPPGLGLRVGKTDALASGDQWDKILAQNTQCCVSGVM
jgi:hypothetical protein